MNAERIERLTINRVSQLVLVFSLVVGLAPAVRSTSPRASAQSDEATAPIQTEAGRYIVELRDDIVGAADVTETIQADDGVEITQVYEHAITGFAGQLSEEALADLNADPRVREIVPDGTMVPFAQTIPPGVKRIGDLQNPTAKINGVDERVNADIAILDMGVGPHSDLNVVGGVDCTFRGYYTDNGGHGTHVAGIAAALDNGSGTVGVAPGARLWSVKVLDAFAGNWSWVICGIDWVTAHADVIDVANMSIGEVLSSANRGYDGPMHRAIQRAVAAGVTFAVAAGNGGHNAGQTIPAMYPEVITVSAFGDSDGKPGGLGPALSRSSDDGFANFSAYGAVVDISAPGVDTLSTRMGGGLGYMSGTSFATPHVVGAAALYIAAHRGSNGRGPGPAAVRAALLAAATPGPIPGDPDGIPEGRLNVATLSGAVMQISKTSAVVGASVQLTLTGFKPSAPVKIAWDGGQITILTTSSSGAASYSLVVPNTNPGTHEISADDGATLAKSAIWIVPSLAGPTSARVGDSITVSLRGFKREEVVDLKWPNGSSSTFLGTVTVSRLGAAEFTFTAPDSFAGAHLLSATGARSSKATLSISITPNLTSSRKAVVPGNRFILTLTGFRAGEAVTINLVNAGVTTKLANTTVPSSASGRTVNLQLPYGIPQGSGVVKAIGNKGSTASVPLGIMPPATPTPSPTATATGTATATATPTIEAGPTGTATPTTTTTSIPTESPSETPVPSATNSPEPPTATPTLEPTATDVPAPSATPTPSPTPV